MNVSHGPRFGRFTQKQVNRFMKAGVFNHLKADSLIKVMGLYQQSENLYEADSSLVGDIINTAWKDVAKGVNKALSDRNKEFTPLLEKALENATLSGAPTMKAARGSDLPGKCAETLAALYADPHYETPDTVFDQFMKAGGFDPDKK